MKPIQYWLEASWYCKNSEILIVDFVLACGLLVIDYYYLHPFSPIYPSFICVCLTDGAARIFTVIPLFYPSRSEASEASFT